MAKNFGARKNSKYKVISSSPSVNKTPRGPVIVNVPYDVQQDFSKADGTSPNVNFNGDPVYVKTSHSTKVTGDKDGSQGGVKSGTVEAQSDPIEASSTVFVNGKAVVRVGDKQHMQGKNTIGKVTSGESGSAAHITDEGKIVGLTQPEPIPKPYSKNKPTNNPRTSGALGSRTGSPVLVGSGKLLYSQTDMTLIAPLNISLERVYVSNGHLGIFGTGWCSDYEQRLIRSDAQTLTLSFPDNRTFGFTLTQEGYEDRDALNARLISLEGGKFELVYFSDGKREVYDNGHLSHIQDRNGNTLTLIRTANGRLERIESGDASLSLTYNREGLVERVVDYAGRVWQYLYDTKPEEELLSSIPSNLISVTDPLGGIKRFEYSNNLLIRCLDETARELLSVTYATQGKVATYTQEGETFSYTYQNNRTIKTHEDGSKTFYAVDDFGCISAITYSDGTTTKEIFQNNTSTVRDRGENIHTSTYDERGRLIHYVYPGMDTREIVYTYEGENPFFTTVTKNGQTTSYGYDDRYNLTSLTTPDGIIESFEYDERGNKIVHINREGIATHYAYNHQGQIIRSMDVLGGITQYVYDTLGNRTAIVDPMERIERFTYNPLNRLLSIRDNAGAMTSFSYDPSSRMTSITDSVGNTTRYAYDALGYLKSETLPDGLVRHFTFHRGKLVNSTSQEGILSEYTYDKAGRLVSKRLGGKTTQYTYDELGNLLGADDGITSIAYVYDTNANLILERQGNEQVVHAYAHDGSKRFIGYEGMHYTLKRDENHNLISIAQGEKQFGFQYNPSFSKTALTYPNKVQETTQYDALGRPLKREVSNHILLHEFMYDKSSLIVSKNDIRYTYDESKQLIEESDSVYAYDAKGNRIDVNTPLCIYDTLGRLTQKQTDEFITTYEYDGEGRLINYARTPIHGSTGSPRTEDTTLNAVRTEPVEVQLTFTYDPLGRRLTKHYKEISLIPYSDTGSIPKTKEYHHRYLYAGDNIVAIYDNNTDTLLATLLHEEDAIDSPLSIHVHPQEPMNPQESIAYEAMDETQQFLFTQSRIKRYYYHRDYQNSILALSDDDANVVERYTYDAFGNITKNEIMKDDEDKAIQTLNPYRFTGREFDTDDLYYYRARYYDPTLGRFITPDPIGFLGGDMNLHRYVGNDPVNFVDPSGLIVGMAVALANAVKNRPSGSYDGNPFNGKVPDTTAPLPKIPNATAPQGKTAVSASKPKAVEVKPKNSSTRTSGAKVANPNLKPKEDEKCKDQKWHDPIDNPQLANYTQGGHIKPWWNVFGEVRKGNSSNNHQGVDLFAVPGTPVYACVDSTITRAGYTGKGYGNVVVLKAKCPDFVRSKKRAYNLPYTEKGEMKHGPNFNDQGQFYFMYAHLSKISTTILEKQKLGEKIELKAGDIIGEIGTSGYKTSRDPHLHFEILNISNGHKGLDNRVNPGFYINYKLPNRLLENELKLQKDVATSQVGDTLQGDPSLKK